MRDRLATAILCLTAAAGLARAQVVDESFETSGPLYPNPAPWTQSSTNFGTPLCDGACFGPGQPTAARTGQWWAWFGGTDLAYEHASVSQVVTIAPGTASLRFYLSGFSTRNDGADNLKVLIDGVQVWQIGDGQLMPYSGGYLPVAVTINAFAGATRTLTFDAVTHGGGYLTNFFVDDITIVSNGQPACYANCDDSTAIPLLTANDFQCFLNRFATFDPYANCDESTVFPQLTATDFQCFLNRFASGCS